MSQKDIVTNSVKPPWLQAKGARSKNARTHSAVAQPKLPGPAAAAAADDNGWQNDEPADLFLDAQDCADWLGAASEWGISDGDADAGVNPDGGDSSDEEDAQAQEAPCELPPIGDVWQSSLIHHSSVQQQNEEKYSCMQQLYERSLVGAIERCPHCGAGQELQQQHTSKVQVLIVRREFPVKVEVPVDCKCSRCSHCYTVQPTAIGCLPCTSTSWHLSTASVSSLQLWWDRDLLDSYDIQTFTTRSGALVSTCSSILDTWQRRRVPHASVVSLTTLRKRMAEAVRVYQGVEALSADAPEQLPGYPSGALNSCPCCGVLTCAQHAPAAASSGLEVRQARVRRAACMGMRMRMGMGMPCLKSAASCLAPSPIRACMNANLDAGRCTRCRCSTWPKRRAFRRWLAMAAAFPAF